MGKKQILITLHSGAEPIVSDMCRRSFVDAGYEVRAIFGAEPLPGAALKAALENASGYIVGLEQVNSWVLDGAPALQSVSKFGVGTDNIDIAAAAARGIAVSNCPGSNSNAVAELALGLMISLARNTHSLCSALRSKKWLMDVGSELSGKCVGILGFGNVGRRLAKYLHPFNAEIIVYDALVDEAAARETGAKYASLDEVARRADFISIHLPLLSETANLLDADFFRKTKRGVYVLNLARGGIVDEQALLDAVQSGQVSRAATDVYASEPPFTSKMLQEERILVLPHIGAATKESTLSMMEMAIENVRSVIEGRGNPHPVNAR